VIRYLTTSENVINISTATFQDSIHEILGRVLPNLSQEVKDLLIRSAVDRERLRPTALPSGVAFPRIEFEGTGKILCAVGLADKGIICGPEKIPVHTFFLTLYPKRLFKEFLPLLEHLVAFSQNPQKMALLRRIPVEKECFAVVQNEVLPWGARDWMQTHLVTPLVTMVNRVESMVRLHNG
jgi:mannitol/fructose-specific phosphotransferase system IIA component (Ntr-type)